MENIAPMLILASQSSARKALLAGAGLRFDTARAAIDERALETAARAAGADAPEVALALAEAKAKAVSKDQNSAFVIGADQTLALGPELLHKPMDRNEAARQLDRLRGRSHHLHAGVALAQNGQILWSGVETATLTLRDFSQAERDDVLDREGEAILGCVGSYRLEGPSIRLFAEVDGDYFTILGLPLLPLLAALRTHAPFLLSEPAA